MFANRVWPLPWPRKHKNRPPGKRSKRSSSQTPKELNLKLFAIQLAQQEAKAAARIAVTAAAGPRAMSSPERCSE